MSFKQLGLTLKKFESKFAHGNLPKVSWLMPHMSMKTRTIQSCFVSKSQFKLINRFLIKNGRFSHFRDDSSPNISPPSIVWPSGMPTGMWRCGSESPTKIVIKSDSPLRRPCPRKGKDHLNLPTLRWFRFELAVKLQGGFCFLNALGTNSHSVSHIPYCLSGTNHTSQIFPPQQKGTSNSEVRCDDFQPFDVGEFGGVGRDDWTTPGREAEADPPPPTASPPVAETTVQVGWFGGGEVGWGGMVRRWMVRGWFFTGGVFFFFWNLGVCWEVAQSIGEVLLFFFGVGWFNGLWWVFEVKRRVGIVEVWSYFCFAVEIMLDSYKSWLFKWCIVMGIVRHT